MAAAFMLSAGLYGLNAEEVSFSIFFTLYTLSVAFYMPTLSLSNSVAYSILERGGMDTVSIPTHSGIRNSGFICTMWLVDTGIQTTEVRNGALIGLKTLRLYAFTLPNCPISTDREIKRSLTGPRCVQAL